MVNMKYIHFLKMRSCKIKNPQKGVAIVITFFVMTVMIVSVSSIGALLLRENTAISDVTNSMVARYVADAGIESVFYYNGGQHPLKPGICNICNVCDSPGQAASLRCSSCQATALEFGGCNIASCGHCAITYESFFNDKSYQVSLTIDKDEQNPAIYDISVKSTGTYKNISREMYLNPNR